MGLFASTRNKAHVAEALEPLTNFLGASKSSQFRIVQAFSIVPRSGHTIQQPYFYHPPTAYPESPDLKLNMSFIRTAFDLSYGDWRRRGVVRTHCVGDIIRHVDFKGETRKAFMVCIIWLDDAEEQLKRGQFKKEGNRQTLNTRSCIKLFGRGYWTYFGKVEWNWKSLVVTKRDPRYC